MENSVNIFDVMMLKQLDKHRSQIYLDFMQVLFFEQEKGIYNTDFTNMSMLSYRNRLTDGSMYQAYQVSALGSNSSHFETL